MSSHQAQGINMYQKMVLIIYTFYTMRLRFGMANSIDKYLLNSSYQIYDLNTYPFLIYRKSHKDREKNRHFI